MFLTRNYFFKSINCVRGRLISNDKKEKNVCAGFKLDKKLVNSLNCQIQTEIAAAYNYLALTSYFNQQKVSMPGFTLFHREQIYEEQQHAHIFLSLLMNRGGTLKLSEIPEPAQQEWDSPLSAFQYAHNLETTVLEKLNDLQTVAIEVGDHHALQLIQSDVLSDQYRSLDELTRIINQLEKVKDNYVGIKMIDSQILSSLNSLSCRKHKKR